MYASADQDSSVDPRVIECRDRRIDLRASRVAVMGILNVTPDSFSDGGRYTDPDAALERARTMVAEGATLIDVGGASSRPAGRTYGRGAQAVPPDEEIHRIRPVVERITAELGEAIVSVDTVHASVAEAALEAGAHIVNDITALRHDPDLAGVVADAGAAVVLMHSVGPYGALEQAGLDGDPVPPVVEHLRRARDRALEAGIRSIVLDPGFGFGKSPGQNLRLLARTDAVAALGHPVLVAVSRKSTIGAALDSTETPRPVEERLFGSLGATAVAIVRGASIVRTHDVAATRDLVRVIVRILETDQSV